MKVGTESEYTAAHFSAFVVGKTGKTQGAVYVRLFMPINSTSDTANSFTKSGVAGHGEVGEARWWRIVHLKDDILTLWMADPYRNSSKFGDNNTYEGSTVQSELLADFAAVYSEYKGFGKDDIDAIITAITPYTITTTTGDGVSQKDHFINPAIISTDKVWLVAAHEIVNVANDTANYDARTAYVTTRAGQWQVNGMDRGYGSTSSGFSGHAWTRSGFRVYSTRAAIVTTSGIVDGVAITSALLSQSLAIRPALHINLAEVQKCANSSIVAEIE